MSNCIGSSHYIACKCPRCRLLLQASLLHPFQSTALTISRAAFLSPSACSRASATPSIASRTLPATASVVWPPPLELTAHPRPLKRKGNLSQNESNTLRLLPARMRQLRQSWSTWMHRLPVRVHCRTVRRIVGMEREVLLIWWFVDAGKGLHLAPMVRIGTLPTRLLCESIAV